MEITIRNITKDTMVDFDNDHTITLPMDEGKLNDILGNNEWIIVDSPIGDELTSIKDLNILLRKIDEDTLMILGEVFLINEIMKTPIENFTIINFDDETSCYNYGNGVLADDWWKGYVLHNLGYKTFPFRYTEEMESYLNFEKLWHEANCEGWVEVLYDGNTYLVKKW